EIDEVRLSTEDVVSTDKEGVSTYFEKVSTDRPIVSTEGSKVSADEQVEGTEEPNEGTDENLEGTKEQFEGTDGQIKSTEDQTKEDIATQATQTPTSMIFRDDETIATILLNMSQAKAGSKEKEVDYKNLDRKYPIKEWKTECLGTKPQTDQAEHIEEINLNVVIRSNGQM
ncbi:hypothetical protein Tco_0306622, partial [Tanacetum coccineum]